MPRPLILDVFCGAGGAAVGYERAGFDVVGVHGHLSYPGELALRREAMAIEWMTNRELTQAVPPAYTHYLGAQLLRALEKGVSR